MFGCLCEYRLLMLKYIMRLVFCLSIELVHPSGYSQHQNGGDNGSCKDRYKLGLYQVEIKHDSYSWRYEEETDVSDKEIGNTTYPFQSYHLRLQQHGQQQHSDDARRQRNAS